jgi:hypothetical protein
MFAVLMPFFGPRCTNSPTQSGQTLLNRWHRYKMPNRSIRNRHKAAPQNGFCQRGNPSE